MSTITVNTAERAPAPDPDLDERDALLDLRSAIDNAAARMEPGSYWRAIILRFGVCLDRALGRRHLRGSC